MRTIVKDVPWRQCIGRTFHAASRPRFEQPLQNNGIPPAIIPSILTLQPVSELVKVLTPVNETVPSMPSTLSFLAKLEQSGRFPRPPPPAPGKIQKPLAAAPAPAAYHPRIYQ